MRSFRKFISLIGLAIILASQTANATWYPIALAVPQFENGAGVPYSGAVLKAYQAGTTTNTPLATSSTGLTTATSISLNANGYPNLSGTTIIPYIDRTYKLSLFPSQAAANTNTGAIWTVDNINPTTVSFDDSSFTGTTTLEDLVVSGSTYLGDVQIVDSINDTNNNPVLDIGTTASAINRVKITNAAAAGTPLISAVGGDTNISLNFLTKGTGVYNLLANATGPTDLRLYEDTDNGTNYVSFIAPSVLATNIVLTLPSVSSTLITSNEVATQANQETATSTTTFVSPGRQQYHPSASKAWVRFDGTAGSPTVAQGYNVTSITKNVAGDYTINFTVSFSSASAYTCTALGPQGTMAGVSTTAAPTASAFRVVFKADDGGLTDGANIMVSCFGDQ